MGGEGGGRGGGAGGDQEKVISLTPAATISYRLLLLPSTVP